MFRKNCDFNFGVSFKSATLLGKPELGGNKLLNVLGEHFKSPADLRKVHGTLRNVALFTTDPNHFHPGIGITPHNVEHFLNWDWKP